jgi:hypothetical protein
LETHKPLRKNPSSVDEYVVYKRNLKETIGKLSKYSAMINYISDITMVMEEY